MSDTTLVRAQHKNGEIRYVPEFWTGDRSPFPGNWTEIEEDDTTEREQAETPSILDEPGSAEIDPSQLRGEALNEALRDAGLSTDGRADEKRQRLADFHNQTGA